MFALRKRGVAGLHVGEEVFLSCAAARPSLFHVDAAAFQDGIDRLRFQSELFER